MNRVRDPVSRRTLPLRASASVTDAPTAEMAVVEPVKIASKRAAAWHFLLIVALASLGLLLLVIPANALQQPPQVPNETCLICHQRPDLSLVLPSGEILPVTVDAEAFSNSVHGQMGVRCQECHTDIAGYPHGQIPAVEYRDLAIHYSQTCANCHEEEARLQRDNVHARVMAAGVREAAVCADCHGSHEISWINREKHPEVPVTAPAEVCRRCHNGIYQKFRESVHGRALYAGSPDVPSCIGCHPAHTAEDPRTLQFRLLSPEICGGCHGDKKLMAKYGISTHVFDTYVADFHGKTVLLFEKIAPDQPTNKAVCMDCHGAHDIQEARVEDLAMKEKLVRTCRPCHPDATSDFASSWLGHYAPDWQRYPLVTAVTWFYYLFIPAVLGFFLIYIILDLQGRLRHRARRKGV